MLNPWYVTGVVEGEGCFSVSFSMKRRFKVGIETRPSFSISLNKKDVGLLEEIRKFFACGGIRYSHTDRTYKFEVRSVRDLCERIIPHFEKYPLHGSKKNDYERFKEICRMVRANLHLSPSYLRRIIEIAYEMNPSGKRKYAKEDLLKVLDRKKV